MVQNMTLDAFVMALACFLTTDNNPKPVYLNSQPNFQLSNTTIGCQMQQHHVLNTRMRDLTMLKLQNEITIKDLEYKVTNLNATQQLNPFTPFTIRNLENQIQIQAAQINQYVAEVQTLKDVLKNQELSIKNQIGHYQFEVDLLRETIKNAGNYSSKPAQDVRQLETEVKMLKDIISNHEDSLDRQQSQIYRYENEIDDLKNTINEHSNNRPNYNPLPDVCENVLRYVPEQRARLDEFKQKIEEIRNVIANRLNGPGPNPDNGRLNSMLNDCRNDVERLENVLRHQPGPNYGYGHGGGHGGGVHGGGFHAGPGGGHGGGPGNGPWG